MVDGGLFPTDPSPGMVFELLPGIYYRYDAAMSSWVRLARGGTGLPMASPINDGLMAADDLKKLNRIVFPPPRSTLIGTDCLAKFDRGLIQFYNGDHFINVDGSPTIENIDQFGDRVKQIAEGQMHQHTHAFDFTIDLPSLFSELQSRSQVKFTGTRGERGGKGGVGARGADRLLSGPAGPTGPPGGAPPSDMTVAAEPVNSQPAANLKRVITGARVETDAKDPTKFKLVFTRKPIGPSVAAAAKFEPNTQNSRWVMGVAATSTTAQQMYYFDIQPIIDAVFEKYRLEVQRLKLGYEDVVKYWLNTMAVLYDQQRAALCCALAFCRSRHANTSLRRHIEMSAATAAHDAKVTLAKQTGYPIAGTVAQATPENVELAQSVSLNPITHVTPASAVEAALEAGSYVAVIKATNAKVGAGYRANLRVEYNASGELAVLKLPDFGDFPTAQAAREVYEGLAANFEHGGGPVKVWLPNRHYDVASGLIEVGFYRTGGEATTQSTKSTAVATLPAASCRLPSARLSWYLRGVKFGTGCSRTITVGGQPYVVMKRSLERDQTCGGGESATSPCLRELLLSHGHPSFAWPLLANGTAAPVPNVAEITFSYDPTLMASVHEQTGANLGDFSAILFPLL
jgi:hypothetical protein